MHNRTVCRLFAAFVGILLLAGGAAAQIPGLPTAGGAGEAAPAEPAGVDETSRASLDDLIRILETDATRARLIESLRALAYRPPAEADADATSGAGEAGNLAESVPAALALYTRSTVEALQMAASRLATVTSDAANLLAGARSINLPRIFAAILPVFSVAIATFAVYFGLTFAQRPLLDWIAGKARPQMPFRRLGLLTAATLVSAGKILLSGLAGHVAAFVFDAGPPNLSQTLFLNAFVLTGLIEVTLSAFMAPYHPSLRMTPFSDGQARYWYGRLAFLILLLGYTFLFVGPVVEANSNLRAANAVRFLVVTVAFLIITTLIIQNRVAVRERLHRSSKRGDKSFQAKVNLLLGHVWWPLALAFVFALYALWLSSPRDGFRFMLGASLKSLAAIAIGGLVITLLSRLILSGIKVPDRTKEKLPLLERRINAFIPKLLIVLRTVVIAIVFAILLEAWNLLDLRSWLSTSYGRMAMGGSASALVILCVGFVIYLVVSSWVEYRLNPNYGSVPTARERTLLSLFRNAFTIALAVIVTMLVLSQIGIDIAPLLAGAGVVGLAIGFGSQKLVQDIITGAFIQIENVMNEGDVVMLAGVSGSVEKLTIRSVSLRALDGTYYLIPFSAVDQVANMTKDFSNFVADVEVAYREDLDEVRDAMREAFARVRESEEGINIIADFEILGVEALGVSSVLVRGRIRTLPGKQWGVGRAYKEAVKRILDERGIEIPFPQTTIWFGDDKKCAAPPRPGEGQLSVQAGTAERASKPAEGHGPEPETDAGTPGGRR